MCILCDTELNCSVIEISLVAYAVILGISVVSLKCCCTGCSYTTQNLGPYSHCYIVSFEIFVCTYMHICTDACALMCRLEGVVYAVYRTCLSHTNSNS
jgi:hypothetical protein